MSRSLTIYTDGACQGNPGPAGIGVVIIEDNEVIKELSKYIGEATNNIAEYQALIYALEEALILRADSIDVFTDSELMYNQVIGQYKVKHANMKPLYERVMRLWEGFETKNIQAVPRAKNAHADRLATQAIKQTDLSKQ